MSDEGVSANKCFSVAISATRVAAEFTEIDPLESSGHSLKMHRQDTDPPPQIAFSTDSILAVAGSHGEAKEIGLRAAREKWPDSEGWFGHHAAVSEVPRSTLEQLLGELD